MTFKPGMHQIVESRKHVDFDAIAANMVSVRPQTTFPLFGWGKKCFIQATCKKNDDLTEIEFFTEVTFGPTPADEKNGYQPDDATVFQGVQIIDGVEKGKASGTGEIMSYADFVEQYITDDSTKAKLDRVMEDMAEAMSEIPEMLVERINDAWEGRKPGTDKLFSVQYM